MGSEEKKFPARFFEDNTYNNKNPLVRWYFFTILKTAVKSAELKGHETALDFGCNTQQLKKFIPKKTGYIGYDIFPECSDVKDYRKTRPDIVFALNVFEHLGKKEFLETLENFEKMGVKKIIVANPTTNGISIIASFFAGVREAVKDLHKQTYSEVCGNLEKAGWKKTSEKNILTLNKIQAWAK